MAVDQANYFIVYIFSFNFFVSLLLTEYAVIRFIHKS